MSILKGRKAIVIGDRDGVPGMAIAACAESAGAEVVFSSERPQVLWIWRIRRESRSSWSSTEQKTLWFCWVLPRARVPVWQPRP